MYGGGLSGVLQYLEHPYSLLADIVKRKIQYIIVDRTRFTLKNVDDRLTVQMVHPKIYKPSYPVGFSMKQNFFVFSWIEDILYYDFRCPDIANVSSVFKEFIFELNIDA